MARPGSVTMSALASEIARGDAEVGDERFALMEQDVFRFDVAVQDALAVGVVRACATARAMRRAWSTGRRVSRVSRSRSDSPPINGMT